MRILNFGSLNLDYVYQVEHFVRPGETLAAREQKIVPGGKGLNQSVALARAGADVWHGGCAGTGGQCLVDVLRENQVHTEYIRVVDEIQGNAVIQVDPSGENCIVLYGGSNRAVTGEQVQETLDGFEAGEYLILQNEINSLPEIIELASQKGMRIVLNPSPFEESLREIDYGKLSWLLVNQIEAQQLTGEREPERVREYIRKKYPDLKLVMTMGADGAWCFTPEETLFQPAFRTRAVDTTAAGDTFTGYFLQGLAAEKTLEECMKQAAVAAGLSVTREGASVSIPCRDEVERYINT